MSPEENARQSRKAAKDQKKMLNAYEQETAQGAEESREGATQANEKGEPRIGPPPHTRLFTSNTANSSCYPYDYLPVASLVARRCGKFAARIFSCATRKL